jgi:hypothetical protein
MACCSWQTACTSCTLKPAWCIGVSAPAACSSRSQVGKGRAVVGGDNPCRQGVANAAGDDAASAGLATSPAGKARQSCPRLSSQHVHPPAQSLRPALRACCRCAVAGAWKLAGFAFSAPLDFRSPDQKAYDYSERDPSLLQQVTQVGAGCLQHIAKDVERCWDTAAAMGVELRHPCMHPSTSQGTASLVHPLPPVAAPPHYSSLLHPPLRLQPPLPYVAPELVAASATTTVTGAADVFSLGAVAFELLARLQLLPVGHNLAEYESRVHSLTLMDMPGGWAGGRVGGCSSGWVCLLLGCFMEQHLPAMMPRAVYRAIMIFVGAA